MILFLSPYFEEKPWAGEELNKIYDTPKKVGEAWIVSGYKNKSSIIKNGKFKGQTLRHVWNKHPELFGNYIDKEFPLLLKLISAKEDLSVQVHPNDNYALKRHNKLGKYECWYVLPETKAKYVSLGINVKNAIELNEIIKNQTIENYLINKKIEPHDLIFVEPGRVHSIHKNSFILEVQESSDVTYRLYDYNREPKRDINIEDSLNVINYNNDKNFIHNFKEENTFKNPYFNIYKLMIDGKKIYDRKSFELFYVIDGVGTLNNKRIHKGDTFILTSEIEEIIFDGNLELIAVIPKPKEKERLKMRKTVLITGIIGQDGYFLTKLLLEKDYEVHGIIQSRGQFINSALLVFENNENFFTHIGDMTDTSSINRILENVKPDEIYHLASQSHIDLSFDIPEYTAQVNALGTLRLLDAIKSSDIKTKLFNLSTPYLFSGDIYPQNENTPFNPKSPFAISKLYAHNIVSSYRENYSIFAVNGICFNHTSPKRDVAFVSKKIIDAVIKTKYGIDNVLELGNINATREWGNTKDYAYAMWLCLQQDKPDDYVISTGKAYSIRYFVEKAYSKIGITIKWSGKGLDEVGVNEKTKKIMVRINPVFIRPNDANVLVGDSSKFFNMTGYSLPSDLDTLIDSMLED